VRMGGTQWWLSGFSYEPAFSGWSNYCSDGDVLNLNHDY
jgi:hypothetical protein